MRGSKSLLINNCRALARELLTKEGGIEVRVLRFGSERRPRRLRQLRRQNTKKGAAVLKRYAIGGFLTIRRRASRLLRALKSKVETNFSDVGLDSRTW